MSSRSYARVLAPLALIAVAFALLVVIVNSSGGDESSSGKVTRTTKTSKGKRTRVGRRRTASAPRATRFYTVKQGDILSTIAERTGVAVERIQELNPDIDAHNLVPGQRLRMRQ